MSGGHFNYEDWHIKEIAEKITQDLQYNDISYENPITIDGEKKYGYQLEPDIVKFMKKAVKQLQQLSTIVHEYDWMISGDTGPETFRERVGLKSDDAKREMGKMGRLRDGGNYTIENR